MQMRAGLMAIATAAALSAAPALAQDADATTTEASAPVERIATMTSTDAQFAALEGLVGQEIDVADYTADPDYIELHDLSDMFGEERAMELRATAEATGHLDALQGTVFADVVHEKILDAAGYTRDDILAAQLGDGNTLDIYVE